MGYVASKLTNKSPSWDPKAMLLVGERRREKDRGTPTDKLESLWLIT